MSINIKSFASFVLKHNILLSNKIKQIEKNYESSNNLNLKNDKFIRLIHGVFDNNKFYKNLYSEHGIEKSDIKTINDISKLPLINKQTVIENSNLIKQGKYLFTNKGYTSGTTGTPLEVYRNYDSILTENAYVWWFRLKSGLQIKDKKISIRGDLDRNRLYSFDKASNTLHISSFALNDNNIKKLVAVIKSFKPKAALGYPSSLFTIASWLVENNEELDIPLSFTSSESLLVFQEEKINQAFKTKIYDWYGNAERTISLYREEGKYYEPFLYSINEYTQNNVITTSLTNDYFPLIRYEVNDKIIVSKDFNIEKKSFAINSIEGRVEDYIVLLDGSKIGRLDVVFKGVKNIKFAQIIQEEIFCIIVKIVKGANFSSRDEDKLTNNIMLKLGEDFKVHIQYIEKKDLEITSSGKFKLVISKIKNITN